MDGFHHQLEDGIEDLASLLRVTISEQFHRALEIRKEDGDLLALTFEGGSRGKDPLREMSGSVGIRRREGGRGYAAATFCE